ncbi:hypothetical protein C8J56DRAFT_918511 [Mycena floridula]|nr:hypothetical protein C8J56DRAFT_918511 [Mycena floridula]
MFIPQFLSPLPCTNSRYHPAIYDHGELGSARVLWWSPRESSTELALLFIPGNPGIAEFYCKFLNCLHDTTDVAILAQSHLSHTSLATENFSLECQIQSAIEAFDGLSSIYPKVVICGHSVGSWIALQVLKARPNVHAILLVCPTIIDIAKTPNGRVLAPFFNWPAPYIISTLARVLYFLPTWLLCKLYRQWPKEQVLVLEGLLQCPSSIFACLSMAHQEMISIRDIDTSLLEEHVDRTFFFFGHDDDWVGETQQKQLKALGINMVECNVPHAFCIGHETSITMSRALADKLESFRL